MNFHGGQCPKDIRLDFSVNIPKIPYSKQLKETWIRSIENLYDYPEIDGKTARKALAGQLGISENLLILGNGATELIYLMARAFAFKRVMILEPTFTEYRRALQLNESEIFSYAYHEVEMDGKYTFEVDPIQLAKAIKEQGCQSLFVCNPNNPTGKRLSADFFKTLLQTIANPEFILIIDESFIDFRGHGDYLEKMKTLSKDAQIIQLRSMTKTYAVPGLRIGYLTSNEVIVEKISVYKEPWTLNRFALESIPVLISDSDYLSMIQAWCIEEFDFLKNALEALSVFTVYESDANFMLVKLLEGDPDAFHNALQSSGIYLRTCYDFEGLGARYFRIAIRQRKDHLELIKIMRRYFNVN